MKGVRTAWISGASSGIGAAVAERLAARGVEVVLSARRRDRLVELAHRIEQAGGRARVEAMDVGDPAATTEALRRIDDEVGGLDLVVANAGIGNSRWAGKLRWEDCAPTLAVNVDGAVASLLAVLPRMVERGRGHLVGISSLAGYRGLPASAAYCASKAFLMTFLESLRMDLRGTGVAVTDVRPGFVRTELTAHNRFAMPFLLDVGPAADRIVRGIARKKAVVTFPWPLVTGSRLSRLLPAGLWDRMMGRAKGPGRRLFDDAPARQP